MNLGDKLFSILQLNMFVILQKDLLLKVMMLHSSQLGMSQKEKLLNHKLIGGLVKDIKVFSLDLTIHLNLMKFLKLPLQISLKSLVV